MNAKYISLVALLLMTGCSQKSAQVVDNSGSYYSKNGISRYAVVVHGDTLSSIAGKFGVSENDILELNKLKYSSEIVPGRTIAIPMSSSSNNQPMVSISKSTGYKAEVDEESGQSKSGYLFSKSRTVTEKNYPVDETGYDAPIAENKLDEPAAQSFKSYNDENTGGTNFKLSSPLGSLNFEWPVSGRVIKRYGKHGNKFNDGINIAGAMGDAVSAAADGKVVYLGSEVEGYGNLVILKHDNGYMSAYAHLHDVSVAKGASIKRGETIGTIGKSGNIQEPQIHFSIRKGKKTIDPETAE